MRIIIKQSLEWQSPLYSVFVDFQKAFDNIDRETIWKLMQHYGFPSKFITIIQQLNENVTCQVIHEGKLTEPFFVQTGGRLLSPKIFLIVIDWVIRKATKDRRIGIQWTLTKQLEDLDHHICGLGKEKQMMLHRPQTGPVCHKQPMHIMSY